MGCAIVGIDHVARRGPATCLIRPLHMAGLQRAVQVLNTHVYPLIEAVGLKGFRIGDARIAPEHGNFIVNCGRARARDIAALIQVAREKVLQRFQVKLKLEIQLVGHDMKL